MKSKILYTFLSYFHHANFPYKFPNLSKIFFFFFSCCPRAWIKFENIYTPHHQNTTCTPEMPSKHKSAAWFPLSFLIKNLHMVTAKINIATLKCTIIFCPWFNQNWYDKVLLSFPQNKKNFSVSEPNVQSSQLALFSTSKQEPCNIF